MKPRVALIGTGPIAEWHVRALRAADFDVAAVASRPGSLRAQDFAAQYSIPKVFEGWRSMLASPLDWDALVIAIHTDVAAEILAMGLDLDIPILVEKPVAWNSKALSDLATGAHARVIVGFNRRFYRTVQFAHEFVAEGSPVVAHLSLPESVVAKSDAAVEYLRPFFSNSCHGLDLLRYVFGAIRIVDVRRIALGTGQISALAATMEAPRGDIIQLTCNWGTPANFGLTLDRVGRRVELKPFEEGRVYDTLDIIEPSETCPVRRYVPRVAKEIRLEEADRGQKPGFLAQALALRALVEGRDVPACTAGLADAVGALALCEELSGITCDR
ncbi:MAG: Gfo/Idh/MocA family oxidoreductase [Candidatus Rokubacteria bacterium]|nr:Gfo/Idh/MocA family oxidoreductase [Candidatus Rokubacteria bacterium]